MYFRFAFLSTALWISLLTAGSVFPQGVLIANQDPESNFNSSGARSADADSDTYTLSLSTRSPLNTTLQHADIPYSRWRYAQQPDGNGVSRGLQVDIFQCGASIGKYAGATTLVSAFGHS